MRWCARLARASLVPVAATLAGCSVWQAGDVGPDVVVERFHRGSEALAIDAESLVLATGGWDGGLALWTFDSPRPIRSWDAHRGSVQGVAFHAGRVVSGGYDGSLKIWTREGDLVGETTTGTPVMRVAVGADTLVAGHEDGSFTLWRLPDLLEIARAPASGSPVSAVAAAADGVRFAASDFAGAVRVLDRSGVVRSLSRPPSSVASLAFSEDGTVVYGGGWRDLYRWSARDGTLAVLDTPHWGAIAGLQYVPARGELASISRINDSSIFMLDPMTGEATLHLLRQPMCGSDIVVSPDGRYLAATGDDGAIRIWDLAAVGAG